MAIPYKLPPFRDYQLESYDQLWNHEGIPTVLQLPTGAGKGLIISKLLIDLISQSKSVLVLVPTIELLDNIYDRIVSYSSYLKPFIGRMGTGRGRNIGAPIVIAVYKSVASLLKSKGKLPYFHVVISDECHHSVAPQWMELLNYYANSWNIGFTATPARLDGKPLNLIYKVLIESKPVSWFIENGYLCDYVLKSHKVDFKLSPNALNDDLKNQQDFFDRKGMIGDSIREWEDNALGQKTLFFCTGISHAIHVMNEFNDHFRGKYQFGYIGSNMTNRQREKVLNDYKSGELTGLTNVAIVTEGVDIPDISCVSLLRFTSSLPLWLQMIGRALRPKPDGSKATLLDHAGNALEHGAPDFDHEWDIEPIDDSVVGYAKINCPNCELPVISYKKLASYGEAGIDLTCSNCKHPHHFQHTPEERAERNSLPWMDTSQELVTFDIDPIIFKINKILNSNRLQQKKIKAIVDLNCGLSQKVSALEQLGLNSSAIDTYLDLPYDCNELIGL